MSKPYIAWHAMPSAAKLGVALWAMAWFFFLINIYRLTQDSPWVAKISIAVILLCFFLLRGQNWARIIALMAGAMATLFLFFLGYAYAARADFAETAVVAVSSLVFIAGIYFLLRRVTADFFKSGTK